MTFFVTHTTEQFTRIAIPPEYEFTILKEEFSSANNHIPTWKRTRKYSCGAIELRTTVSLSTDICQRTGERTTSAVVLITVTNWNEKSSYTGSAKVIFLDPLSAMLLNESDVEERDFEKGHDYVKFEVGMGSHGNIERCPSKKLKVQVKVRVQEKVRCSWIMVYPQKKECSAPTH